MVLPSAAPQSPIRPSAADYSGLYEARSTYSGRDLPMRPTHHPMLTIDLGLPPQATHPSRPQSSRSVSRTTTTDLPRSPGAALGERLHSRGGRASAAGHPASLRPLLPPGPAARHTVGPSLRPRAADAKPDSAAAREPLFEGRRPGQPHAARTHGLCGSVAI